MEAAAWREHQLASPPAVRRQYGIDVRDIAGGTALVASRGPIGMNRVIALGFDHGLDGPLINALADTYRRADVPRFLLQWSPAAINLTGQELVDQGFSLPSRMAKLFRRPDASASASTDLTLVEIDRDVAELYGQVVAAGHGDPPDLAAAHAATVGVPRWHHYLAYDGSTAVAGATLFCSQGVAWCGFSATLASARNRGAHTALLARRVRDAAMLGSDLIVCETVEETDARPNPAYRNMRRAGFELAYLRPNLVFTL